MAISLQKGQRISLEKEAGTTLDKVVMGLGWDEAVREKKGFFGTKTVKEAIDLDASCLLFDENKNLVDAVWFRQLGSRCGAVTHTGDNRTGEGDGDDEQIIVDLSRLPASVKTLVFTVNSFTGESFADVPNAFCRIVNGRSNAEIARYDLSVQGAHTAQIMAKLYRHTDGWKMQALGENSNGRIFEQMMPQIIPHL